MGSFRCGWPLMLWPRARKRETGDWRLALDLDDPRLSRVITSVADPETLAVVEARREFRLRWRVPLEVRGTFNEKRDFCGNWYGQVLQRREGLRLHLA